MSNIRFTDRLARAAIGILALQAAYFWLGTPWNYLAYGIGAVLLITAALGYCPLYSLIGLKPIKTAPAAGGIAKSLVSAIVLAALAIGGSYGSAFFSRKFFLEDFNAMNHFYKQTLFLTGKNEREGAISNLDQWKPALAAFVAKYSAYRPYDLKGDAQLGGDFAQVTQILESTEPLIRTGDLHQAHVALEAIRPIFQDMFKRNGFSMLSIALVDFHDAMETVLATGNAKDAAQTIALYPGVSDKLKLIEAEANDAEIQAIRAALEDLLAAAKANQADALPAKADALKSSFVKVYLKRG